MDFQVHKNKVLAKTRKAGQTSVEYILIIVVIATAVLGLVSFSDTIKSKVEMQKLNLAQRLGGRDDLQRSDFTFKNVEVKNIEGTGEEGAGGAGGRAGRAGRGRRGGAGDGLDDGTGAGRGRRGSRAGAGGEDEDGDEEYINDEEKEEALRGRMKAQSASEAGGAISHKSKRARARRPGVEEGEGYLAEDEDESSRFLKTKMQEDLREKQAKEEEMKKWNIMKFLIILAIVFLFIVIILKARNARD